MSGGTALQIIAGRQEPVHGGKRYRHMQTVKAYLLAHTSGGTYEGIANAVGLTVQSVQYAVGDIKRFDPDLIVAVPTVRSGWRTSLRWRDIMHGQVNQARHLKTRSQTQANDFRKMAASGKFPPYVAQMFLAAAAQADAFALQQEAAITTLDTAKVHARHGTSAP
jgi:hypothetical protein